MSTNPFIPQATIHVNVMESLVNEEIERQLKPYSSKIKKYINKVEVATFALNRLPALYASSEQGKVQQQLNGRKKYKREIAIAVRRGLAAVEQDPLRKSTPLMDENQEKQQIAETALKELQQYLQEQGLLAQTSLSWKNLTSSVYQALSQMAQRVQYYTQSTQLAATSSVHKKSKDEQWLP
ncbi:MAG: late competence development ComFB family protein [Microcystaceae cyanobacterium]